MEKATLVKLDGKVVEDCVYANEKEGMVRRFIRDHTGVLISNRGVVEIETICGDVQVEFSNVDF